MADQSPRNGTSTCMIPAQEPSSTGPPRTGVSNILSRSAIDCPLFSIAMTVKTKTNAEKVETRIESAVNP